MVIDAVEPEVDGVRFPIKRVVGEAVRVRARIFADGHDRVAGAVLHREDPQAPWREEPLRPLGNDLFEGSFRAGRLGTAQYTVEAWVDAFGSWSERLRRKRDAGQDVAADLLEGAALVRDAAGRASPEDARWLESCALALQRADAPDEQAALALDPRLAERIARYPDRRRAARHPRVLEVQVERERARSGAWYEFFPRSCAPEPGRHGTLRDAEARLAHAAAMGFDVVYLPPVHPIGRTARKGRNNANRCEPGDPGSPWAIGAEEGGHTSVHPELGSLGDFDRFVATARGLGLEVALDLAFQCSPDHPWVRKHPEWFRRRPDGSVRHAENPPKSYEDIYPLDLEGEGWRELWEELRGVVRFWIDRGVTIFRVDNPHTKPLSFWEWLIREVRSDHPEVVFLSEAFTRPSVMHHLAKAGFSQSYTYFTWRNTKAELAEYFGELGRAPLRDFLRPNLFTNTPDILHPYLQTGGRAAFQVRAALAATLAGSWGIYGPPFELCEAAAIPGTEEYRDSEKYQLRHWDLERPGNVRDWIRRLNEIRREHPALTRGDPPRFHPVDDDRILAYSRRTPEGDDLVVVIAGLDPHHAHAAFVTLPLGELGIDPDHPYQMDDLLGGARYLWSGPRNFVALDPAGLPVHVFRVRHRVRTERDFDYYA